MRTRSKSYPNDIEKKVVLQEISSSATTNNNKTNMSLLNSDASTILKFSTDVSEYVQNDATVIRTLSSSSQSDPISILNCELGALKEKLNDLTIYHRLLSTENAKLTRKVNCLELRNDEIFYSLTRLEKELANLAQYGRRESIEILGIPRSISDDKLEETVLEILKNIGLELDSYDLVAVHRLKGRLEGNFQSTIVRFLNRKDAYFCLENKKELLACKNKMGFKNLFFVENLCPFYKELYNKCKKLKEENKIKHVWSHHGVVQFRFTDSRREKPKKLYHHEDLDYYFPEKKIDILELSENDEN